MQDIVKIGVIGAGNMGKNHIRVIRELSNLYKLVGFFDNSSGNVKKTKEIFDIKNFNSIEELIKNVDAVIIAVPSSLHKEIGVAVANSKVHALIEKPIALSKEDGLVICEEFEKNKKILMVGHIERYNPVIGEVAKILENEEVIAIEARRCSPYDPRVADASVIMDLMIHDIDLVFNKLYKKEIENISARGISVKSNKIDYINSIIKHKTGIITSIVASRVTEEKVRTVNIHTKNSYIKADLLNRTLEISRKTSYTLNIGYNSTYKQENILEKIMVPTIEPLKEELKAFHNSIKFNKSEVTGEEAVRNVEIASQIEKQL